jgi:hypothetical protein
MRPLLKRWWFWSGAVGLAAIVVVGVVAVLTTGDSTQADFSKIRLGMTKEEVDKLIEVKPDIAHEDRYGIDRFYEKQPRLLSGYEVLLLGFVKASDTKVYACEHSKPEDTRTLWRRIQDEYRYQKHWLGW